MPDFTKGPAEPDYRFFELAGDHYACGCALGRTTELRPIPSWRGALDGLRFARACADVVREIYPPLLEEYRGYADAQGRPWEDVLPHFSLNHPSGEAGGCSSLAWRSAEGHVMVARNYDFLRSQRSRHLLRAGPAGALATLGTNASLIGGRYDGVNQAGLFVALHLVQAEMPARLAPGLPFHLVPRILLETCATARQAVALLLDLPVLHAFNYLLADAGGFAVVEAHPSAKRVREGDNWLAVTNHFQHPDMQGFHGRRTHAHSRRRAEKLRQLALRPEEPAWSWAQTVLRDHGTPLCHHDRVMATLWALVGDITARRIAYCQGAPCQNSFVELAWSAETPPATRVQRGWPAAPTSPNEPDTIRPSSDSVPAPTA